MTLWASILKGLLTFFNSLFAYLSAAKAEELGRLKAEKEGRESVETIVDTLDRIDAGRVPKPDDKQTGS